MHATFLTKYDDVSKLMKQINLLQYSFYDIAVVKARVVFTLAVDLSACATSAEHAFHTPHCNVGARAIQILKF